MGDRPPSGLNRAASHPVEPGTNLRRALDARGAISAHLNLSTSACFQGVRIDSDALGPWLVPSGSLAALARKWDSVDTLPWNYCQLLHPPLPKKSRSRPAPPPQLRPSESLTFLWEGANSGTLPPL